MRDEFNADNHTHFDIFHKSCYEAHDLCFSQTSKSLPTIQAFKQLES